MNQIEKFLSETREMTTEWYKLADAKAQIILGFTGLFLSLVVGTVLSSERDSILDEYIRGGSSSSTKMLLLMIPIGLYGASVVLSARALWSRSVFENKKKGIHFFVHLANYLGKDDRETELGEAIRVLKMDIVRYLNGGEVSTDELTQDVMILARNTKLKHRLVNLAAVFAGLALICTLASVVIIILTVVNVR
jgi:hypothetical protein